MEDINVVIMDLPASVNACHTCNEDGSWTLIINARASSEQQKEAALHELKHIERDDLHSGKSADLIEWEVRA